LSTQNASDIVCPLGSAGPAGGPTAFPSWIRGGRDPGSEKGHKGKMEKGKRMEEEEDRTERGKGSIPALFSLPVLRMGIRIPVGMRIKCVVIENENGNDK